MASGQENPNGPAGPMSGARLPGRSETGSVLMRSKASPLEPAFRRSSQRTSHLNPSRFANIGISARNMRPATRSLDITQYVSYIGRGVIIGFADAKTRRFFREGACPAQWRAVSGAIARKLDMLDAAPTLAALRSPPGNRLEALKADRAGQFSIRVNQQWRICFVWTEAGPDRVEVVDYH